ncbi:MAG: M14 family zinc carboxypeptidase [Flavobacteriaceae bacterium]
MNHIRLLIFCAFFPFLCFSQKNEKFHKVKINYTSPADLVKLAKQGVCIDHGLHKKNHFFISDFSESEIEKMLSLNFDYEILINDVTHFYKQRNKLSNKSAKNIFCEENENILETPENYDFKPSDDFGGFYTYNEMLNELDDMHSLYPEIISARSDIKDETFSSSPHIHETYEGRYLQWVKISDNPNISEGEPQILYTALHHAREPASLQQLIYFMWYLLENYDSNDSIKQIIDNSELFFVPCVNPDGYIFNETIEPNGGGMWRKNTRDSHGVDNNRNYSYIDENGNEVWNTSGTSSNPYGSTYAGDGPFSESENRAIRYFVESNNFKIALNNHTYGNLLLYPYGYDYNQTTDDDDIFQFISSALVSENNYDNIISADLYPAAGDSDDFMYGMLNTENNQVREKIFAMTPEIGSSFWPQASTIEDICKGMLHLNLTAAKMIGNYASLKDFTENFISSNTFSANFELQRLGIIDNGSFNIQIEPISSNIISTTPEININSLNIGEIINESFQIELNESTNSGEDVIFKYILDNGSFSEEIIVKKIFGAPILLFEDESDNYSDYWTIDSSWSETFEEYNSPQTSITDSPYSNYSNNALETINLLNDINLSGYSYAEINFNAKWNIESGYDYVQIEISNDGGASWEPQCGKYTRKGVETQEDASDEPLYDGNQGEWVNESILLTDYIDQEISIRFKLKSDGGLRRDGFYYDDFKIKALSSSLSSSENTLNKAKIYPIPADNMIYISSEEEIKEIKVFDVLGKEIMSFNQNNIENFSIENLKSGVYIIKLFSLEGTENHRIIKK